MGVERAHVAVIDASRAAAEANVEVFRRELAYRGPSVIIARRECLEAIKAKKKQRRSRRRVAGGRRGLRGGGSRMTFDIILAGVGGQGVLSIAAIIAGAAMADGLKVRQSEVHGMAQRGGAVSAHLRISDSAIHCDLIPSGGADMILSMEPVESLRYLSFLKPEGVIVTAAEALRQHPGLPRSRAA